MSHHAQPEVDLSEFRQQKPTEQRIRRISFAIATTIAVAGVTGLLLVDTNPVALYLSGIAIFAVCIATHVIFRRNVRATCSSCGCQMRKAVTDIDPVEIGPGLYYRGCEKVDGKYYCKGPNGDFQRLVKVVGVCESCREYAVISRVEYTTVDRETVAPMAARRM